MDEYFSHEEIISLKELGLYNDVKKIIDTLRKEKSFKNELKQKKFTIKQGTRNYGKTMQQMEQFVDILRNVDSGKIYGIYKTETGDILFIYDEMIPKKDLEKLLY